MRRIATALITLCCVLLPASRLLLADGVSAPGVPSIGGNAAVAFPPSGGGCVSTSPAFHVQTPPAWQHFASPPSTVTFSSVTLGTTSSSDLVIIALMATGNIYNASFSSVTVNGVNATYIGPPGAVSSDVELWVIPGGQPNPSNIVFTDSLNTYADVGITVGYIHGLSSITTPTATGYMPDAFYVTNPTHYLTGSPDHPGTGSGTIALCGIGIIALGARDTFTPSASAQLTVDSITNAVGGGSGTLMVGEYDTTTSAWDPQGSISGGVLATVAGTWN
jgi:hypothetical protein